MPARDFIHVSDIALLRTIVDHPNSRKKDLWQPFGKGLWNQYLRQSGLVRNGHCTVVKGLFRFVDSIATLKLCGYLRTDTRHYNASDTGINLFYTLDPKPCRWPLTIKLNAQGERDWDSAVFYEKQ